MSDAEVMTTAIVAALYFGGDLERARGLLAQPTHIPRMLSKSRFNRRLHALEGLLIYLFQVLGEVFKQLNASSVYLIDSFPIPACDNIRILARSATARSAIAAIPRANDVTSTA